MKEKINIDYLGHNIKVTNTFKELFLIIDGEVRDSYKALIAFPFVLQGYIEQDGKQIEIRLDFQDSLLGGTLFLTANGQLLVKKRLMSR